MNILLKHRVNSSEISHAFSVAKTMLSHTFDSNEKEQFICLALERAAEDGKVAQHVVEAATEVIEDRLGGFYTLEEWVQHCIKPKPNLVKLHKDTMQEFRHRWLDELIREFGEKAGLHS